GNMFAICSIISNRYQIAMTLPRNDGFLLVAAYYHSPFRSVSHRPETTKVQGSENLRQWNKTLLYQG
ncbi:MAG: hypothetical protein KAI99_12475, partial [Cyclobacteriaceae bacterium]|nr:hypothetical protein [Cyclobacteriaceae bacterium]